MSVTDPLSPAPPDSSTPAPQGKTSGLAIASLVLGIAGFLLITIPVSVILGIIALITAGKRGQKGKPLAIIGIILAVLWSVGISVGVAGVTSALMQSTNPTRGADGQVTAPTKVTPAALKVGDCVAKIAVGQAPTDIQLVPCSQPNGGKVFAVFDLPKGNFPGAAKVETDASEGCSTRYTAAGQQADKKSQIFYLGPSEASWRLGDQTVTCLVAPAK